jgi:hypothetical protein
MPQTVRELASSLSSSSSNRRQEPMSLAFSDGRSCKDWLKSIPLTNVGSAQRMILDAVRTLNRSEFVPIERLTCMELLRDKVAFVQAEQRAKYTGKTIPLNQQEMQVWEISRALVEEMEAGYRKCFGEATAGAHDVEPHIALIIQRVMRYIGLQMLFAAMIYRRFDSGLWMRLHLQWIEAESRGLIDTKVKDSVGSIDGVSSISAAYVAILLGQLANTHEMSQRQMDFTDAILKRFATKVEFSLTPVTTKTGQNLAVDLFSNSGVVVGTYTQPGDHVRFLDTSALAKSLRGRVGKLQEGVSAAELNLPDWPVAEMQVQLTRLFRLWCEGDVSRSSGVVPDDTDAHLAFGLEQIHYFLTGQLFEQPGRKREMTRQELNDIAMFGKVSAATLKSLYGDAKPETEKWGIVDEGRGMLRVLRPSSSPQGLAIGRIVGVRVGSGPLLLASVRAVVQESDGTIYGTLSIYPGAPAAIAVRSADLRNRPNAQFTQAIRLPAVPALNVPETLIIPAALTQTGRGIDISAPGETKEVTLEDFVERGMDYDRITYF